MKYYDFLYAVTYRYFQKLWGEKSDIVPFNVSLGLSLSLLCFIQAIISSINLGFDYNVHVFSNKSLTVLVLGIIVLFHYYRYEHAEKYKKVLAQYKKLSDVNSKIKIIAVYLYLFGSILSMIVLAIVGSMKR